MLNFTGRGLETYSGKIKNNLMLHVLFVKLAKPDFFNNLKCSTKGSSSENHCRKINYKFTEFISFLFELRLYLSPLVVVILD